MRFPGPELSRYAIVLSALSLITIALGALVTSNQTIVVLAAAPRIHTGLAAVTGALLAVLLIWLAPSNTLWWVRATGWVGLGTFVIDGALGFLGGDLAIPHAILAPVFLSAMVLIAAYTWPGWEDRPTQIDLTGWPALPLLANAAPPLVLLQIALGAAYRHKVLGVMPHMAGAMLATLVVLMLSVVLLQQFPTHTTLRPAAICSISILLVQVTLGIGAFVMRLLDFDMTIGFSHLAATHVCTGALTLASSCVLAAEVRRCTQVQPVTI